MQLTLPRWYDLHAHFRQGAVIPALTKDHLKMGCAGILAMPNTKPPVAKINRQDDLPYWSIEEYHNMLLEAGGTAFSQIIVPLYLTKDTTPAMIADGAASGLLRACKYYPPHGTTGADFGCPLETLMNNGVFAAMQEHGVILCIHGEEHDISTEDYFDRATNAEEKFYREHMPRLVDAFPALRIVAEHVTTKVAADFVSQTDNVGATVTPQHLLYTAGHLLRGLKYHLYCLPLIKFEEDRAALRKAVTALDNTKFFAGTDSAPHTKKVTPCGCAAGCYTGGIAPQLYAQAFETAGTDLSSPDGARAFEQFLCRNGADFYDLPVPDDTFTLSRQDTEVSITVTPEGEIIPLPLGMESEGPDGRVTLPWSIG